MAIEITIHGVEIKNLKTYGDDRGFFREIIRSTDTFFPDSSFAQWSHSRMIKNVVKAWHYHQLQTDWWYLPIGVIQTVLFDNRQTSPSYGTKMELLMGDSKSLVSGANEVCVKIPPGVLHGCKVLTDEAHLFYITSFIYNPEDEGRFPYNDPVVSHNWGDNVIVAPNDMKLFVPTVGC